MLRSASVRALMLLAPACFFISGFTGLVYELLWMRLLVEVIGSAPYAISIILAVFMAGLGIGSFLASRVADRLENPVSAVALYGLLELAIGAYALALPGLIAASTPLFRILYNSLYGYPLLYHLLTLAGCTVLLILPAICMGATLPILCRFYVKDLSHVGTRAGTLYCLNTIGAAAGSLACGFWLVYYMGVQGALLSTVVANGVIGAACLAAACAGGRMRGGPHVSSGAAAVADRCAPATGQSSAEATKGDPRRAEATGVRRAALMIFGVSGFCAMAYEVIWTKLLALIIGPTAYAFTIVLVTFITGLALGSLIFGWLGDRSKNALRLLAATQIAAALSALAASQIMGNGSFFFSKLIFTFRYDFALLNLAEGAALFALMILPTVCLGAAFPLVSKICTRSPAAVGRSIGAAYCINTIGAVLGPICAGFVLIPLAGKETALSVVAGLQLAAAAAVFAVRGGRRRGFAGRLAWAAPALFAIALCTAYPHWDRSILAAGKYHRFEDVDTGLTQGWLVSLFGSADLSKPAAPHEVVYYGDGIGGFTTVMRQPTPFGRYIYVLANSGKADASSFGDMKTQTLAAHFPLLFHPDPREVMVLGLASGVTAGEALLYPVDRIDVLEISRDVVEASDFFLQWNSGVLSDPRTNLIVQDGRAHLQHTDRQYDVIISEPSNPWMAGLAALFTRDFFRLARERLKDGGIMVQFLHSYQMDWDTFALVGRSFADVFPKSLLLATDPVEREGDFMLVGFCGGSGLDLQLAQRNVAFTRRSTNVALEDPKLVYRLIVAENLNDLFGPGPIDTDRRPLLEFRAPKLLYSKDPMIRRHIEERGRLSQDTQEVVRSASEDVDAQIDYVAYGLSVHIPCPDFVELDRATAEQKERLFRLMEDYCRKHALPYSCLHDPELIQRCSQVQIDILSSRIHSMPDKALSCSYLAALYLVQGRLDESIAQFQEALRLDPDSANVHGSLGTALFTQERFDEALVHFSRAAALLPDNPRVHSNLGRAFYNLGRYAEAAQSYAKAVHLEPSSAFARTQLGAVLVTMGKRDEAIAVFAEGLRFDPGNTGLLCNLAIALAQQGKYGEALGAFERALQTAPDDPQIHSNLGIMLVEMGLLERAAGHLARAIELDPADSKARVHLGRALAAQDRLEEAIDVLEDGILLERDNAELQKFLRDVRAGMEKR